MYITETRDGDEIERSDYIICLNSETLQERHDWPEGREKECESVWIEAVNASLENATEQESTGECGYSRNFADWNGGKYYGGIGSFGCIYCRTRLGRVTVFDDGEEETEWSYAPRVSVDHLAKIKAIAEAAQEAGDAAVAKYLVD